MTSLLEPAKPRTAGTNRPAPVRRPLALSALGAGVGASLSVLTFCMAIGLAGWFAAEAGAYGTTKDAIRIGADAWLLAHGSPLDLPAAQIAIMPLGLTLLCGYVCFRLGRWAGATSEVPDDRTALLGVFVMSGVYSAIAVVTALLATTATAQPHLAAAAVGSFVVAALGGGAGILTGCGRGGGLLNRVPEAVLTGTRIALAASLLLYAASAALLAARLFLHLDTAANVLSLLHIDTGGGILASTVVASLVPNAVLLTSAYLVGPGFAVGHATLVSPSAVVLGPLPSFPLLAALPQPGPTPWWTTPLTVSPALVALVGAVLVVRRAPLTGLVGGGLRGLGGGVGAAALTAVLVSLAGGAVGPGRMADVGAAPGDVLLHAVVAMAVGGLVGGLLAAWWTDRHGDGRPDDRLAARGDTDEEDTVRVEADPDEPTMAIPLPRLGHDDGPGDDEPDAAG